MHLLNVLHSLHILTIVVCTDVLYSARSYIHDIHGRS